MTPVNDAIAIVYHSAVLYLLADVSSHSGRASPKGLHDTLFGVWPARAWADDGEGNARTAVRLDPLAAFLGSPGDGDGLEQRVGYDAGCRLPAPCAQAVLFDGRGCLRKAALGNEPVIARKEAPIKPYSSPHRVKGALPIGGHVTPQEGGNLDVFRPPAGPLHPSANVVRGPASRVLLPIVCSQVSIDSSCFICDCWLSQSDTASTGN